MRVRDLKENYEVLERDGAYHLYDPNRGSGRRNVYKYLCSIQKESPTKFKVKGFKKSTSKFEELQQMIDKKVASYKYDSEYYDPNYRRGFFEEIIIHDYMDELGFSRESHSSGYDTYVLKRPSIYGHQATEVVLTFRNLDTLGYWSPKKGYKNFPKEVDIMLSTGDWSWISSKAKRNVEDIKKGINSLLKPLMLTEGVENVKSSEKMEEVGDVDLLMQQFSIAAGMQSKDAKAELKKKLISLAESL